MKNIWVLETDKPSSLYLGNLGNPVTIENASAQLKKPLHIYITDNSQINSSCFVFDTFKDSFPKIREITTEEEISEIQETDLKIVLTTDETLIKQGVQKISDEFLNWWVNNSNCEYVDLGYDLTSPMGRKVDSMNVSQNHSQCTWKYKIIIPQEKPKHIPYTGIVWKPPKFESIEEMNNTIINNINSKVKKNDLLVLLGDHLFGENKNYQELIDSFVCDNIIMLYGNHCNIGKIQETNVLYQGYYLELQIDKQIIVCSHYPIIHWNYQSDGSIMIFGHCIDINTEILTTNGWKTYETINKNDLVYSLTNEGIKEGLINEIIKFNDYNKEVFLYNNRFASICVTDEHRMLELDENKNLIYTKACDFFNDFKKSLILTGSINKKGINLSDDLLSLYIFLAADGSYNPTTNLARTSLIKTRKIIFIENLLNNLKIKYSKNPTKEGGYVFNFKLPLELKTINIKGLDKILLDCSEKQVDLIAKIYSITDGYVNGNSIMIYTSKKEELELLQHLFSINNYSTTSYSRIGHGFSNNYSYQLGIVKNRNILKLTTKKSKYVKKIIPDNKFMWCINTEFENFLCRRNGRTYFTGNCHGFKSEITKQTSEYKTMDVGIDCSDNYEPFSYQEILEKLKDKTFIQRHE